MTARVWSPETSSGGTLGVSVTTEGGGPDGRTDVGDGRPASRGPGAGARALPHRADRLLLPDARARRFEAEDAVQETMVRAWRALDRVRGPLVAALVALPHRHERVPRHAERPQRRARPMDLGPPSHGRRARCPRCRRGDVGRARSPTTASLPTDGDPAELAVAREIDPAGLRRRPAAPAAAPARGADPPRGAALAGRRGRRAARAPPSRRSTARCSGPGRRSARARSGRRPTPSRPLDDEPASSLARYVDAFERYDMDALAVAAARGRHARRCRRTSCGCTARDDIVDVVPRPGHRVRGLAPDPDDRRTARRRSGSTSRATRTAATSRGRSRCSRSRTAGSSGITFFLDTERLFPLFGLPPRLDQDP